MSKESAFIQRWQRHVKAIQAGLREGRRSSRIGAMPSLVHDAGSKHRIEVRLDVQWVKGAMSGVADLVLARQNPAQGFTIVEKDGRESLSVDNLQRTGGPDSIYIDGVAFKLRPNDKLKAGAMHRVDITMAGRGGYESKIVLQLDSAALGPVMAESTLRRSAEPNMTVEEVSRESAHFAGASGGPIVFAATAATGDAGPSLELYFDNAQPGRDAVWRASLVVAERFNMDSDGTPQIKRATHITHAPFMVAQILAPRFDPESGTILAQWNSDDPDGAQWRFAVETVDLHLMAQSIGESMVRGRRFNEDGKNGLDPDKPVNSRFSRATDISVRPSRKVRRYSVHPGDIQSVLKDAQLQKLVSEMVYPLEFTYQRTPQSKRDIIVSELGQSLGQPAISLPQPKIDLKRALGESMSALLARWYLEDDDAKAALPALRALYVRQRARHLANRANFNHRIAHYRVLDAARPEGPLDLAEGVTARLRSMSVPLTIAAPAPAAETAIPATGDMLEMTGEGAAPVYSLPLGINLTPQAALALQHFVPQDDAGQEQARSMPIGLVNMIEFASELRAVLAAPESREVLIGELSLSVLGATGTIKAAFDEGRTVFEAEVADGQLTRSIKTRVGRIGVAWNRAIHVIVYERSTAPGAQFKHEQPALLGWPVPRKMQEYIEILEPLRLFGSEATAPENRCACLHSFGFATRRIYVNGAWGRDLDGGYEIPLFNPNDTSGFYSSPWFGPLAESGSGEQVRHWHDHPQDMVFYTSTVAGAGADTNAWPAVTGVDADLAPSFGNIATAMRASALDNLKHKVMPSYHMGAADNPRFAMRVRADGPSNITHGRGTDKLVAPVTSFHIERTAARSRLSFEAGHPLASLLDGATPLWHSVKAAAEVNSVEAVIARIDSDARALLDSFGTLADLTASCGVVKSKLCEAVNGLFDEALARVGHGLDGALTAIDDDALTQLVLEQSQQIRKALGNSIGVPAALLQAACEHAVLVVDSMRERARQLEDEVTAPGSASAVVLKRLVDDQLGMGLSTLLERAAATLNCPLALVGQVTGTLTRVRQTLTAQLEQMTTSTDELFGRLQAIRDGDAAQLYGNAIGWIDRAPADFDKLLQQYDHALDVLRKMALPESMAALRNAREQCVRAMLGGRSWLFEQRAQLPQLRGDITKAGSTAHDAIRAALDTFMLIPYAQSKAALAAAMAAADAALQGLADAVAPAGAQLSAAQRAIRQTADEVNVRIGAALATIENIVNKTFGSLGAAKAELDGALLALRAKAGNVNQSAAAELVGTHRAMVDEAERRLAVAVGGLQQPLRLLQISVRDSLQSGAGTLTAQLQARRQAIIGMIDALDCADWDRLRGEIKHTVHALVNDARNHLADTAANLLDADTRYRMAALKNEVETKAAQLMGEAKQAWDEVAPRAGQAVKLVKMLSEPPELPHITINTARIEYVLDDVKAQIETSPFVARLREAEAGLNELGIANPCRALNAGMILDNIDGAQFNDIVKNLVIKFEAFFKKFQLRSFPSNAIKLSHHVDEKQRRAEAKAEIHHQFSSTEQLFDIASFSLDIRKPQIDATSDFSIGANEAGKARTSATFGGDWLLNFGGQNLVEFQDAQLQYNDSSGFKFDLDARKVKMAKPLEFIATVFKSMMPELPDTVKILKDDKGMPIGARIEQNNAIGPFDTGALYIGETVLGTGFGVLLEQGGMKIDTCFNVGDVASPVFMQIGIYGGGGWLTARAHAEVINGALVPGYSASIGVSLGSARSFTLAGVASGTYAIRVFVEATFQSSGGNSFIAGLSVNGSARILGYLNAYLMLLLQVEHKGGSMTGSGQLDVEIEVCWCYSVRVSRNVQQTM